MSTPVTDCLLKLVEENHSIEDYQSIRKPRWCVGCGDYAVLAAVQRLCRDEQLAREKTVFVSGIGCSSRFPHYMNTYGFHGLHGRALPVAQGIKMRRPDLNVFVITGDGDCCSIGTAHWIHSIRYNMNMTVLMLDNHVYSLTKKQASPTSPHGLKSNTSPQGTCIEPLNPLSTTLGIANVSFVAQAADWIPELLYDIISSAFHHKGFSFVRILSRCPEYVPEMFEPWIQDPIRMLLLDHEDGVEASAGLKQTYTNRENHDPSDIHRAREIASIEGELPVGILYRNDDVPCYEDIRSPKRPPSADLTRAMLEAELDKFTIRVAG